MPNIEELRRQLVKLQAEYDATPKSQRKRLAEISNEIDRLEMLIGDFEDIPQQSQSIAKTNSPIAKIAATIKQHSNKRKSVKAPSKDKPAQHKPQNKSGRTIAKKFGGRLTSRQQRASQEKTKHIVELNEHEIMQQDLIAQKPELIKIFNTLSLETIAEIINSNQIYNTVELMAFFQVYCANILKHYQGGKKPIQMVQQTLLVTHTQLITIQQRMHMTFQKCIHKTLFKMMKQAVINKQAIQSVRHFMLKLNLKNNYKKKQQTAQQTIVDKALIQTILTKFLSQT
ncbi:Hypothetical_protein [Hexamita inflata]|uniref:Hypothetical_protein n=1 Tax=Hexamita inflata TaxID=28002 RepID=A0AA86RJB1_9EUKA|nr:Hypothetical protein HINF_LOCUS60819 [Hexamita inflata]